MEQIKESFPLVSSFQSQSWSAVGVTALLIYYIITTLEEEVHYFWTLPISSVNIIFFLARYLAVARSFISVFEGLLSQNRLLCNIFVWSESLLDWGIILCIDYILYLRVRALYSFETRYKKVVLSIRLLLFLNTATSLGSLIAEVLKSRVFLHVILPGSTKSTRFCDGEPPIWLRCLFWVAPLTYGSVLLALALYKVTQVRKSLGLRGLKLVRTLLVDQAVYFLSVMVCSTANIVSNVGNISDENTFRIVLHVVFGANLLALPGSWMLIHLKEIGERRRETGATRSFTIASDASEPSFRNYTADEEQRAVEYSWSLGE